MKSEKKSWKVTVCVLIYKEVIAEECTKQEAWENPNLFMKEGTEKLSAEWEVVDVQPNE